MSCGCPLQWRIKFHTFVYGYLIVSVLVTTNPSELVLLGAVKLIEYVEVITVNLMPSSRLN
jgi:hypothetical protein